MCLKSRSKVYSLGSELVHWLVSLGYVGAFLGPLIGVFTFYLAPWPIMIFTLGYLLNPLAVAIVGATGATLGTAMYYLVGEGVYRILPSKVKQYLEKGQKFLVKYGDAAIFVFAISPLPDELVWIPVGALKYDPKRALVACWLGKFLLIAAIAFAGHLGINEILHFLN
jgi:uncharacterized membrane protein YdjX (TVP38/TMEM64 family)